jgi:hypothetical protein
VIRKRSQKRRLQFGRDNATVIASMKDAAWRIEPLNKEAQDSEDQAKLEPCSCSGHPHSVPEAPEGVDAKLIEHLCDYPGCECHRGKYRAGLVRELSDARQSYSDIRRDQYYPALIKWSVKSVDPGMDSTGKPNMIEGDDGIFQAITLDSIFDLPDEVIDELGNEIERIGSLSVEERLGFPLPGTSSALGDGAIPKSSAETAN